MSKAPRIILAAGAGIVTAMGVDAAIERPRQSVYAVENLHDCADAIDTPSIIGQELVKRCADYSALFTPVEVSSASPAGRSITYRTPSSVELLKSEGQDASIIDQNVGFANTRANQDEAKLAGLAGLIVAFAVGNFKPVKQLDRIPFRRQKKLREPFRRLRKHIRRRCPFTV